MGRGTWGALALGLACIQWACAEGSQSDGLEEEPGEADEAGSTTSGPSSSVASGGDPGAGAASAEGGAGGATSSGAGGNGTGGGGGAASCTPLNLVSAPIGCASAGILISPPFDQYYECHDLGPAPNVPSPWGGLTTTMQDENTLLLGGSANTSLGMLYDVTIDRDVDCHILGFTGASSSVVAAPYNDGGVTHHASQVLFMARWPVNEIGQALPASTVTDKVIALPTLTGSTSSISGLTFVPQGFAAQDQLKVVTWPAGEWYTLAYAPDSMGLFDITAATYVTTIAGGPEGFVYVPAGNALFPQDSMLVSEYSAGKIAAYQIDNNGDPIPSTRVDFVTGLSGAEGALLDALSGDFLFSTFGGSNRVVAIRGFKPHGS